MGQYGRKPDLPEFSEVILLKIFKKSPRDLGVDSKPLTKRRKDRWTRDIHITHHL